MANTIKVKRSSTTGAQPTTAQLDLGEIAINTFDGKMFIKKNNGTASIVEVGGGGGGATNLDGLSDVAITSAARGQVLAHDGTQFVNTNTLQAATSSTIPLIAKGAVGHNTDFFRVTDSNNNLLSRIDFQARGWFNRGVLCTGVGMGLTQYDVTGAFLDANAGSNYAALHLVNNNGGYIDITGLNQDYQGRLIYDIASSQWSFHTAASATQRLILGGTTQSLQLNTVTASTKGLVVKGAASQTANLLEVQNSSGTAYTSVGSNGNVNLSVASGTDIPFTITGASNHTNYLFVTKNSSNTHLVSIIGNGSTFMSVDSATVSNLTISRPASHERYGLLVRNSSGKRIFGVGANASLAGEPAGWSGTVELGNDDYQMVRLGYHTATGALRVLSATDTIQSWESPGGAAGIYYLTLARNTTTTSWNFSLAGFATSLRFDTTVHANCYVQQSANAFSTSLAPASGTLTVNTSGGNAVLGALSASVTTWAFTNVPTDNSRVTKITAVIAGNTSYTYGDACSVNGTAITGGIQWSGGSAPTSTSNTDIIEFTIVRDSAGTVKVFGVGSTNFS